MKIAVLLNYVMAPDFSINVSTNINNINIYRIFVKEKNKYAYLF